MAGYVGRAPVYDTQSSEKFVGNGTQTVFELRQLPGSSDAIIVTISGVTQEPEYAYTVIGKQLTFFEAPPVPLSGTHNIVVRYLTKSPTKFNEIGMTVNQQELTATNGQTVFNLTSAPYTPGANHIEVFVNGIKQQPGSYLETNANTITFTQGLEAGDKVLVKVGSLLNQDSRTAQQVDFSVLLEAVDDSAAALVGVELFQLYRTGSTVKIRTV